MGYKPDMSTPEMPSNEVRTSQTLPLGEEAQVLVGDVLRLLREGVSESGLTSFNRLHPVDQGEVLAELGHDAREIDTLEAEGVIGQRPKGT